MVLCRHFSLVIFVPYNEKFWHCILCFKCLLQCVKFLIHIEDQLLKVNVNLWVLYIHTDHSHVYSSTVLVWECINDSWCFSENHWETPSGIVCILWIYYINGNQRSLKVLSVLQANGDEEIRLGLSKSDHSLSIC